MTLGMIMTRQAKTSIAFVTRLNALAPLNFSTSVLKLEKERGLGCRVASMLSLWCYLV
jgi:hypothetical protein